MFARTAVTVGVLMVFTSLCSVVAGEKKEPLGLAVKERWVKEIPNAYPLVISPDGKQIAIGAQDGTVTLLNSADGKTIKTWKAHHDPVYDLHFHPKENRLVS